jgi:hypothetical protein
MGIDHSLTRKHPSVIINGSQYHYGRVPNYEEYLVENASIAKDYWCFKEQQDLEAFLINLPESADRNLRLKLHPDWREVTPEQRDLYFEEDKLTFRAMAVERVNHGTAQTFNMDLDGSGGPYEPQRINPLREKESPLGRVERQLRDWKALHAPPPRDPSLPQGKLGDLVHGLMDQSFGSGLSEAGKLRVLEGEIDWSGVADKDKESILSREVNFAKIAPDHFAFVYEDIARDKHDLPDPAVARELFEKATKTPAPQVAMALDMDMDF